ncbi:hypothetical protein [Streptomyces rapamycinicus]|uniref:Amino acid dehydrogenase n=2 Tax=Streptomyces rapamycinicus TaxID=1226757 RepID=A0A3L8R5R6_STRRN|nr:hypothetical protein [Streptomyces rapamycinicus]MBB4780437.1 glutamate dehydrogenase/leucine dehydrogenase [Streptomyces rapamycinicus]RLV74910.1 amino acid dehydrogenase [Streptomyces rapamycinicus NRRL 5491]UTO61163.1 hypothetical protein LJB45_01715 [Streptomyces rapamycinicus]UTP29108.1 hypothetical protein LIV37_06835 [Streptomyces rapamycinicus NRRL 5491]
MALPEGTALDAGRRREVLRDVADVIDSFGGAYATGPDVRTGPADMALIGETAPHVFCRPTHLGGSGDSSPHTAWGTLAALRAVSRRLYDTASPKGRGLAVMGLGRVGAGLARLLAAEGAALRVTDIDPEKRRIGDELGAVWRAPDEILTADVDILVPSALGSVLTGQNVAELRCRAVAGPANRQRPAGDGAAPRPDPGTGGRRAGRTPSERRLAPGGVTGTERSMTPVTGVRRAAPGRAAPPAPRGPHGHGRRPPGGP